MSKTLSSNSIYKGGSPRVQHEVLKSKPKIYGQSDINSYIDKIKKHYLAHNITFQDLIYMDNYFTTLKSNNCLLSVQTQKRSRTQRILPLCTSQPLAA